MLVAGASAGDTSSWGGALTFIAYDPPSSAWWSYGSANMLLAGAGADYASSSGAFTFSVDAVPVEEWTPWDVGSAEKNIYRSILFLV